MQRVHTRDVQPLIDKYLENSLRDRLGMTLRTLRELESLETRSCPDMDLVAMAFIGDERKLVYIKELCLILNSVMSYWNYQNRTIFVEGLADCGFLCEYVDKEAPKPRVLKVGCRLGYVVARGI